MGLDQTLVDFFTRAAVGTASVLAVILVVAVAIRRKSVSVVRRTPR
jgi:hypothetical protein